MDARRITPRCLQGIILALLALVSPASLTQTSGAPFAASFSGLVYDRATQTFNSVLTLTNAGVSPLLSPLTIVISTGTAAVTVSGSTDGATYIWNIPGGIAAGQSANTVIDFADPTRVSFTPTVVSVTGVPQYDIGGTVSGLSGSGLVLQDNGGDNLVISSNGAFTFSTGLVSGAQYSVTVATQPSNPAQICTVANGFGEASENVTSVQLSCVASQSITPPQREAVLSQVQSQWVQIVRQGGDFTSAMANYLQSVPELGVVTAEPDGSVSARFSDGRVLIVAHNRALTFDATTAESARAAAIIRSTQASSAERMDAPSLIAAEHDAALQMPHKTAVVAQGFTLGAGNTVSLTNDIAQWLNTAGYSATALQAVTPQTLRTAIKGVDVLLYTGHGGLGLSQQGPTAGNLFALSTGVVTSNYVSNLPPVPAETADDTADFVSGRLVYIIDDINVDSTTGAALPGTWWAITGAFVANYMTFNSGSLIIINTCSSATTTSISQGFPASFKTAGTYLGWTGTTNDLGNDRIRYVFDRLLGEVPGGGDRASVTQESPPQRAFNLSAVLQDMTAQGLIPLNLTGTAANTADGNLTVLGTNDSILAPSIAFLTVDEINGLLAIAGIFDPNQQQNASVTIGGANCPITTLESQYAICTLPGLDSQGDVVVAVNGIKSNVVALTSWRGTFTYKITGGESLQATANFNLHWRADVHNWRTAPHKPPQHYPFQADMAQDSSGSWSASGSQTVDVPPAPAETLKITGGGSLSILLQSIAPSTFIGYVIMDPASGTQWTFLNGLSPLQLSVSSDVCIDTEAFLINTFLADQSVPYYTVPPPLGTTQVTGPAMPLALDATFDLLANQQSKTFNNGCPFSLNDAANLWTLSWPMIIPTSVPDPTAAQ